MSTVGATISLNQYVGCTFISSTQRIEQIKFDLPEDLVGGLFMGLGIVADAKAEMFFSSLSRQAVTMQNIR
jgi:hypothetical protein